MRSVRIIGGRENSVHAGKRECALSTSHGHNHVIGFHHILNIAVRNFASALHRLAGGGQLLLIHFLLAPERFLVFGLALIKIAQEFPEPVLKILDLFGRQVAKLARAAPVRVIGRVKKHAVDGVQPHIALEILSDLEESVLLPGVHVALPVIVIHAL